MVPRDVPRPRKPAPRTRSKIAREVPMERIPWDIGEAGHLEVDLVHHCGSSGSGEYVHTLQCLDVHTGWSERVAMLGRSYLVVENGVAYCGHRIPFVVKELHVDNGSEFLNTHFMRLVGEVFPGARLSRSRPYRKNDNRYVEGANRSLVRGYIGDGRLDTVAQVRLLNHLYNQLWVYDNFFQPVQRMVAKEIVMGSDGKRRVKRVFDSALPPLDRLVKAGAVSERMAELLLRWRDDINLSRLRESIYKNMEALFALPLAGEVKQDVRESLLSFGEGQFVMKAVVVKGGEPWWECSGVCSGVYGE